jgi:transposase
MREFCTYGSVRGALSNARPYRNHLRRGRFREEVTMTDETTRQTESAARAGNPGLGRGGRMSRQRKLAAVLRLLRGEDLELVSRSLGVTAATLSGWRDEFLAGGEAALATKPTDAKALEAERLKAKLGELMLERELLNEKIAILEAGRPLARRRSRR